MHIEHYRERVECIDYFKGIFILIFPILFLSVNSKLLLLTENILHLNVLDSVVSFRVCRVASALALMLRPLQRILFPGMLGCSASLQSLKRPALDLMVFYVVLHSPSPANNLIQMHPCEHEGCSSEASCRMKP